MFIVSRGRTLTSCTLWPRRSHFLTNSLNNWPCITIRTWILGTRALHMQYKRRWVKVPWLGYACLNFALATRKTRNYMSRRRQVTHIHGRTHHVRLSPCSVVSVSPTQHHRFRGFFCEERSEAEERFHFLSQSAAYSSQR